MNKVIIIGNLTADPELGTTSSGKRVLRFTVAVNRKGNQEGADFFRVSAWEKLGEVCAQYLAKGRKVMVSGSVRADAYKNSQGEAVGSLNVTAQEVEFLTPRTGTNAQPYTPPTMQNPIAPQAGDFLQIDDEELPFF